MADTRIRNRQKIPPAGGEMLTCPVCEGKGRIAAESVSIGMRIMIARKESGMTQAELAPKLQIGRAQLANIEGDRSLPSIEVLLRISNVLGVSTDHLLGRR
jgi:DNA-binding XRE family transcriptional regulator